jgi:serine/threonine protein kinase
MPQDVRIQPAPAEETSAKATVAIARATASTIANPPPSNAIAAQEKSAVLDQVYGEYCRLCEAGETVDPEVFSSRYPQYQRSILLMLDVHQFIERNPDLLNEAPEAEWPEIGTEFCGFELLDELGSGSFAKVYLAAELELGNRLVAVKVAQDNAEEAQTIARLHHRNIVPIHSVRTDPVTNRTLICMPYMGRATLGDVLDWFAGKEVPQTAKELLSTLLVPDARFPIAKLDSSDAPPVNSWVRYVLWLGAALADALAETHKLNICHGDIKPSNILLVGAGRPMLVDFNLSLTMGDGSRLGGTLPYIAPEQLEAISALRAGKEAGKLDSRCDLFSLGAILYELLAGKMPFGHSRLDMPFSDVAAAAMVARQNGPVPIRALNPSVDHRTAEIVERCLRFNPAERPQSAEELARELRRAAAPLARAMAWAVANKKLVAATFTGFLVLAAVGGVAWRNQPTASQRNYQSARLLYRDGEFDKALPLLERVIGEEKEDQAAIFLRGRIYQAKGEFLSAAKDFELAGSFATDGRANACAGYCYSKANMPDLALKQSQLAIDKGYRTAEMLSNHAYALTERALWDDAIKTATQAIELDAHAMSPYFLRSKSVFVKSIKKPTWEIELAAADILHAIDLGPPTADIYFLSACIEYQRHKVNPQHNSAEHAYLTSALELGMPLSTITRHPWFRNFEPTPRAAAVKEKPTKAELLIDPVPTTVAAL